MIDIDEEYMEKVRQVIKPLGIEKVRTKCNSVAKNICPARCPYSIYVDGKTECMFVCDVCPAGWWNEDDQA